MRNVPLTPELTNRLNEVVAALNTVNDAYRKAEGYLVGEEKITWKERTKFVAIDIGTSGAWLVEKATGEIYNISGYGVPDHNKKAKANLGNIATVDAAFLFARRYNYLR